MVAMRTQSHPGVARAEIVTTTFVASGRPEGIHDLGRMLELLNNRSIGAQIELRAPAIRPLYRATAALELEAPLLVRREDIIFVTFEGPHFTRGNARADTTDVPILLMAPPFQIQGSLAVHRGAEFTQALRFAAERFFVIRNTKVFDADGSPLGEGDRIIINGSAVQMMSATRRHIGVASTTAKTQHEVAETQAVETDSTAETRDDATRAA
jgi:hypothetical protein